MTKQPHHPFSHTQQHVLQIDDNLFISTSLSLIISFLCVSALVFHCLLF